MILSVFFFKFMNYCFRHRILEGAIKLRRFSIYIHKYIIKFFDTKENLVGTYRWLNFENSKYLSQ